MAKKCIVEVIAKMDRHSLLAVGIVAVACVVTIGASPIRNVNQTPVERPEWRIAQRFDDTRVVALMNGNQLYLPQSGPGSRDSSTLKGRAMYLGSVVEIPETRVLLQEGYEALVIDAMEYPKSPDRPLTVIARWDNSC